MVEVIRTLSNLPAAEAIKTLESLRTETNASIILSTLRDKSASRLESSVGADTVATIDDVMGPMEFEAQNPTAYPIIPPFDPKDLGQRSHPGLSGFSRQSLALLSSSVFQSAPETCIDN